MKVLYVIDTLETGGAEKSLLDILSHLYNIDVIICSLYTGNTLQPAFEQAGIRVIPLNIVGKYAFPTAIQALRKVVHSESPDLIHATLFRSDIVSRITAKLEHVPLVDSFVNDSYSLCRWRSLDRVSFLKLKSVQLLDQFTSRYVALFTAISDSIRRSNALALHLPISRIHVIYRGRSPESFINVKIDQTTEIRKSLQLNNTGPIIINVARLLNRKGQEELIRSIPLVQSRFPNIRLLIAGEGPYRNRLESLIEELHLRNVVQLLGTRNDIPILLQLADVFAFPSHYEGHGGALVEAMFAGRPIVASDTDVHRESISHKETGLLTPIQNLEKLAESIIWLLENPQHAASMGIQARNVAMQKFNINKVADQHKELYTQIL